MATRIFVQCKTDIMPGSYPEKIPLMANAACQKVWNRNFNDSHPDYDRLTTFGGWMNPLCFLAIDNGAVDKEYTLIKLRWKGNKLVDEPGGLHPYIQREFDTKYHFNPALRPESKELTDEELKEVLSPEEYNKVITSKEEMTARHNDKIRDRS